MKEEEVKQRIGEENWGEFQDFMKGQTVSLYPDGTTNYYDWDVEQFEANLMTFRTTVNINGVEEEATEQDE